MSQDYLLRDDILVVLTTSPAGLGHIRVLRALRYGLDENVNTKVLGFSDPAIQFIHRAQSINPLFRKVSDTVQNRPFFENAFFKFYCGFLRRRTRHVFRELSNLILTTRPKPKILLVVCTHFGLAHQIAAIKVRFSKKFGVKLILAVIVTDDSPQKVWAVWGGDYIFVPSQETKFKLDSILQGIGKNPPEVLVSAYPLSRNITSALSESEFAQRKAQVTKGSKTKLKIIIPISGAAVQLNYFKEAIEELHKSGQAEITVVARFSANTQAFLSWCGNIPSVKVLASSIDEEVVKLYEKAYLEEVFSLEITKPSEQSFKVILTPHQRGGTTLLLSEPVGRQETDNMNFFIRHALLPPYQVEVTFEEKDFKKILEGAASWRAIFIPFDGKKAAEMILRLKRVGILEKMAEFAGFPNLPELKSNGVELFWSFISEKVQKLHRNLE